MKSLAYIPPGQLYAGRRTVGGTFTLGPTLLKSVTGLDLGAAQPSAAPAAAPAPDKDADKPAAAPADKPAEKPAPAPAPAAEKK